MVESPKVFISYSHQNSEYNKKVLDFSNDFRLKGIDTNIDQYVEAPSEGWPQWMERQIYDSDYVLVCCSKSYIEKFRENTEGLGVSWETSMIYQFIYDNATKNSKIIPVFFDEKDKSFVPRPLKKYTFYNLSKEADYVRLYNRLIGKTTNNKAPLGQLKPLDEKKPKTLFVSTPIDIDKWNQARWRGIMYISIAGDVPVLGLVFKNYQKGLEIFDQWRKLSTYRYIDEFVSFCFITPPFSKKSLIYSSKKYNFGKGYFAYIGPNIKEAENRAQKLGLSKENLVITAINRFRWMDEKSNAQNRKKFQESVKERAECLIVPIALEKLTSGLLSDKDSIRDVINFDGALKIRNISFKNGRDLDENTPEGAVLKSLV